MAATKKKRNSSRASVRPVISTAVGSLINMTVTVVTSGSVLVWLFTAKRLLT